ncbi:Crp/Fnr family transcriptional regulator [Larkinella insperata]|uniref:Crp/Fnr family transcriptional regulator n=1 Tax=Larkinella insperata TaxID=332158 RepID=A0ABW3QI84_9BACT|nr:Crp/Fnr family transcriptional regulator [Larkinella insperata]
MTLLMASTVPRLLKKDQFLLKEGQICQSIWFVEKGCLRTCYDKDGREINIQFAFETDFVTELRSLRTATPSAYSIQAGEVTTVWEFDKDKLLDLYRQSAEIESFGRNLLEHMLMKQEEHANWFKIYSPAERYHHLLHQHPQLLQRVSLSQLSSYLGVARETLSRIRKIR